ncbi:hypothetical protein F5878DRAFT_710291 [Lentinula raphanica]|uniref:Uncharacterized protein n=1 Tax=Lentinula raphanica TaxID=153919 RepID=A0AA38UDZ5_9AGAR|nr:hypothetical protein F5878DRAFT_710291 [Lentinula raphanica]
MSLQVSILVLTGVFLSKSTRSLIFSLVFKNHLFSIPPDMIALFAAAAAAAPVPPQPVPGGGGGGGNSGPTVPGNNASSVSGINAPSAPGNNASSVTGNNTLTVSGANAHPLSGNTRTIPASCKRVQDLEPLFKETKLNVWAVTMTLDKEIETRNQPMGGDQFQLLFWNKREPHLPNFRLYLEGGNPCLQVVPVTPEGKISNFPIDSLVYTTTIIFSDNRARKEFLDEAFKAGKGDPKQLEASNTITYLDNIVNGPVKKYTHGNFLAKTFRKGVGNMSWRVIVTLMKKKVASWEETRKKLQKSGAQQLPQASSDSQLSGLQRTKPL